MLRHLLRRLNRLTWLAYQYYNRGRWLRYAPGRAAMRAPPATTPGVEALTMGMPLDPHYLCAVCREPLGCQNQTGLCKRCGKSRLCHGCNRTMPHVAGGWCDTCLFAVDAFRVAMSSMPSCPRPDPETLAERLALYTSRAAKREPLFT